uniref:GYF domain-containing protein n=1 Tax=Ciona savignyi TaxID=51511 RepID=H2Z8R9_CIOSA
MSAETLNFGPQWLRDLSSGSNVTSPPPSPATQPIMKFKLAQHRYGREEMLALFEKSDYVPPELLHAPNIISEDALIPLSLIPLTEEDQRAFSGGVNSEVYRRSRGTRGSIPSGRGRSIPTRGRGRGRGELFSRSMSQNDEGPPFGRGSREFGRRESWDARGFNRNGRSFDDAPRKPIRRSDASDDWRNDAVRGSGDGADNEKEGGSDWRPAAPSRKDGWREPSRGSWRDSGEERGGWNNDSFQRDRRPVNRTRSYGGPSKYEVRLMPEWADDADDSEVGVFDSSGAFQSVKSLFLKNYLDWKRTIDGSRDSDRGIRRNASSFGSLRKIEEKEKDKSERGETSKKSETSPSEESSNQEPKKEIQKTPESPAKEPPKEAEPKVDQLSEVGERAAENGSEHKKPPAQLSSKGIFINIAHTYKTDQNSHLAHDPTILIKTLLLKHSLTYDRPNSQLKPNHRNSTDTVKQPPEEENALKLIDSLTEFEDKTPITDPTVPLPTRLPPALDPMTLLQGSATPNVPDLAMKWFYKDPQGETQGPFSSQEMGEWFMAGYFTSTLLVKRACDPQFVPLGDLITRCGAVPFVPQSLPQQMQLQMQMQKQQQLQQLQQQQQYQQQQQLIQQQKQQQILSSSEEFLAMSTQQQQATVAQYLALVQQQPTPTELVRVSPLPIHIPAAPTTSQSIWDDDPTILRRPSPVPMATTQQQQQLVERLKQQEQSAAAKKKQEEEEEKAQREKEEMQRLQQAQEEARRLKMEELHKQHLMEEMQRQAELQRAKEEEEKAQREQEERRLKEEQRRQEEEAKARAAIAKLQEEEREEEEARRWAFHRREEERIRRGVMEEEKRKKQAQEEHEKRLLHLKMVEEERRKRLQEEKQQEQLKNIKLPTTANWAEQQSTQQLHQQQQQMSVSEIQKLQERKEQERLLQEQQMRAISQRQQQQQQRGVWGASPTSYTAATPPTPSTMSLMEIQMEESRNQSRGQAKQPQPYITTLTNQHSINIFQKPELSLQAAVAWGGRTNPTSTGVWGNQGYQAPTQPTYWEQAPKAVTRKPAQPNNTKAPAQQQKTRAKQKANNTSNENNTVLAHFQKQQTAAQSDPFVSWCVTEMRKLPTSADLDITTFVGFLRDLESPDEVKGYITSYLGDSKPVRDFAEAFLQRRIAAKKQQRLEEQKQQEKQKQQQQQQQQQQQAKKQQQAQQSAKSQTAQATQAKPTTDQEVVTGSTKRGKRKQKKLQKVDPSILGFSVNAASGRVNMGEIDTPNDG